MSKSIEQQLAAILNAATTTPEEWAASYDRAQELKARGDAASEDATFSMFAKFGELSAAQGWTDADKEAMDAVISLRIPEDADKSTRSRLRCAADPHVRGHLDASWQVAKESLPQFRELQSNARRLGGFFAINSQLRKGEGKYSPETAAQLVLKERADKAQDKAKPTTTASDFKRARANECKNGVEKNGHALAALFTPASWAAYCDAVAGLEIAVGQRVAPKTKAVESDSTETARDDAPDLASWFEALDPTEKLEAVKHKPALAALL